MEIKVPEVGESIYEGLLVKWHKRNGEMVRRDEPLCEIETDKITIELNAEADGILSIQAKEGTTVKIGGVIGVVAESSALQAPSAKAAGKAETAFAPPGSAGPTSPAARKLVREHALKPEEIKGTGKGGRVTVDDLFSRLQTEETGLEEKKPAIMKTTAEKETVQPQAVRSEPQVVYKAGMEERITRKPMTSIRKRIAERLLAARQQTAMLTTFNEADMGRVIALRQKHREDFKKRHGVALGFMSFFVKACVEALQEFPGVNARIDGDDIVYQHFYDIGIAIGGDKGLVVPVIRDADRLHFAEIEKAIDDFVEKVKTNNLNISDLQGGTFTISNGGVYGSLLSTPILNPPQSGILGMHAIQDRPMAMNGKVVIRPMMYLALTYDHRIIDGRESVHFLKKIKEYLEDPEEMLLEA
jgi:2-oxoglutarate dehydrogenase E2 component (dihydrolipoamide succinyltransferase)